MSGLGWAGLAWLAWLGWLVGVLGGEVDGWLDGLVRWMDGWMDGLWGEVYCGEVDEEKKKMMIGYVQ